MGPQGRRRRTWGECVPAGLPRRGRSVPKGHAPEGHVPEGIPSQGLEEGLDLELVMAEAEA